MFNEEKRHLFISILIISLFFISNICDVCNAEQDTEDIFASVIVLPTFDINIKNNYIDFGLVTPGESVTLKEGRFYNEIKCISNKGINYYVKIHILGDIMGPGGEKIPPSSVKWRVYSASGSGVAVENWQEFSESPALVYTSSPEDKTGGEIIIRFQYKLDLPASAKGGNYSLRVSYMLTE